MESTTLALVLACAALALSIVCLGFLAFLRTRTAPATLRAKLDEIEGVLDAHGEWWKKLNANVASVRGQLKQMRGDDEPKREPNGHGGGFEQLPGETPDAWKARMRAALATGQLRPPRG